LYEIDFNLPALLNNVSEIINIRAKHKKINFYLELANDLPNGVHGDERRLRQILLNLLGNAIKFTDKGNVTLKVNFNFNFNNSKLYFEVKDTGIGIDSEKLESIFEPFKQVGEQEHQIQGTGLGLAISKNLVEFMGGQLCISSQINSGTKFWFELVFPVVTDYYRINKTNQQPIGIKGKLPKILVVDDNLDNQWVLVDLLSPLGFSVETANNGREALEKAIQWQPDVIITDLIMPEIEMDGFELISQLRQSPVFKEKIIIASSASVYESDKKKSLAVGSNAFLPKPIQIETLFEQLQYHLNITWVYGKIQVTAEENYISQSIPMVFPPLEKMKMLYELSMMGNLKELKKQVAILAESDVKLKPFVIKMQDFINKYQVSELIEWFEAMAKGGQQKDAAHPTTYL